jgi:lysophospholipase L1-like esterase
MFIIGCQRHGQMRILSMDDAPRWKPVTWGLAESPTEVTIVSDADAVEGGGAVKVVGHAGSIYTMASRDVRGGEDWNGYDGLAFYVKGDGSEYWGVVRLGAGDWNNAWVGTFPLADATWHEVKLAWADLTPVGSNPDLGSADGARPSDIDNFAFGKSWSIDPQHRMPELAFSIADVRLVKGVRGTRRRTPIDEFPPVAGVVARMKAGEPVTILALGDSITARPDKDVSYPDEVGRMLRRRFGNDNIRVVNAGIGGSTTGKGRQWMLRDVAGVRADLVTIMFGYNEQPSASDPQGSTRWWMGQMVTYIEEVAGTMDSPPACAMLTTIPGRDKDWTTLDPYAQGVRDFAAAHPNVTVADASAHFKAMGKPAYAAFMGDEAHPNDAGQAEIAKVVFEAIASQGE